MPNEKPARPSGSPTPAPTKAPATSSSQDEEIIQNLEFLREWDLVREDVDLQVLSSMDELPKENDDEAP